MSQISFSVQSVDGVEIFNSQFQAEEPAAMEGVPNPSTLVRLMNEKSEHCAHLFKNGTAWYAGNVTDNFNGVTVNRKLPIAGIFNFRTTD